MANHTDEREKAKAFRNHFGYDFKPLTELSRCERDFLAGYAAGRAEWVATSERLPEVGKVKLWRKDGSTVMLGYLGAEKTGLIHRQGGMSYEYLEDFIAWCEIPPYQPNGEKK